MSRIPFLRKNDDTPDLARWHDDPDGKQVGAEEQEVRGKIANLDRAIISIERGVPLALLEEFAEAQRELEAVGAVHWKDERSGSARYRLQQEKRKRVDELRRKVNNPRTSRTNGKPLSDTEREARERLGIEMGDHETGPTLAELKHEREVLVETLKLLGEKRQAARAKFVERLRAEVAPLYKAKVVAEGAKLAGQLGRWADGEAAFIAAVEATGVTIDEILPHRASFTDMRLGLRTSRLNVWLDAVRQRFGIDVDGPRESELVRTR